MVTPSRSNIPGGQGGVSNTRRSRAAPLPGAEAVAWLDSASSGAGHGGSDASQAGTASLRREVARGLYVLQPRRRLSRCHGVLRAHSGGRQRFARSVLGSLATCRARKPSKQHGGQQLQSRTREIPPKPKASSEACVAAAGM